MAEPTQKILYVANVRLPTDKAHGIQIVKTCKALADRGILESLIVPKRRTLIRDSVEAYYGLRAPLPIKTIWTIDAVQRGHIGFLIQTLSFALATKIFLLKRKSKGVIYGRDAFVLWFIGVFSKETLIWEAHSASWSFFTRRIISRAKQITVISQGLSDFYTSKGVPSEKLTVIPDAADPLFATDSVARDEIRVLLGISTESNIVLYTGRLDGWKGFQTICDAIQYLPRAIELVVIGGEEEQIKTFQDVYPRIRFIGSIPFRLIPQYQSMADVLVIPNTAKNETSYRYTSPMKLFNYMAAGIPIVASDVPSIREILDDDSCYFFTPDNPKALATAIITALSDPDSESRGLRAQKQSLGYTWESRAIAIEAMI